MVQNHDEEFDQSLEYTEKIIPQQGQPVTGLAIVREDEEQEGECKEADQFDLGKNSCKAQKKSNDEPVSKRDTLKLIKKQLKKEEAKKQKQVSSPASSPNQSSNSPSKSYKPSNSPTTKTTDPDDDCTGDFAYDHLKQQEKLSRQTLAEL